MCRTYLISFLITLIIILLLTKRNNSIFISSAILIVGLLYFTLDPTFKDFRQNNELFVNTMSAIIATLFGVYAALFATNYQTDKDNRELVIKLIATVQSGLEGHALNFYAGEISITKQNIAGDEKFHEYQDSIKNQGIQTLPEFQSCDLILGNELFLKYANPFLLSNLMSFDQMVKRDFYMVNVTRFKSSQDYIDYQRSIVALMNVISRTLDLQIKEIRKKIQSKDIEIEIGSMVEEFSKTRQMQRINRHSFMENSFH